MSSPSNRNGNPFKDGTREENIARFTEYFNRRICNDADFAQRVLDLRGKRLGCFCKPAPCHGDVIACWIENAMCHGCGDGPDAAAYKTPAGYAIEDPNQEGVPYPDPVTVVLLCGECAK